MGSWWTQRRCSRAGHEAYDAPVADAEARNFPSALNILPREGPWNFGLAGGDFDDRVFSASPDRTDDSRRKAAASFNR